MSQSLTPFLFEGEHTIRTVARNGEPWFVAADICHALGIVNYRDAVTKLDADEKGVASTDTLGGTQSVVIISEAGLYTIVLRCRDAVTPGSVPHRFRRWVTGEVLPSIRKTGAYSAPTNAFGVRVKRRVKELGMTVAGVERAAGWTAGYITDLVNGRKKSVDYDNLVKLAGILKTTDAWLLHGEAIDQSEGPLVPAAQDTPLLDRAFADWTLEEARVKKSIADLYKFIYGAEAAKWIAPQLGFPTPPSNLTSHRK